ncbi:MAG: MazG-like family protein [Candidatus Liptonbacteria bacterium]|nr:MazG-like family protein [Candidatus Liptonbacteria bacterium]
MKKKIRTLRGAQKLVKDFARNNRWKDAPEIDKFDHLHEELIEMSALLRYKNEKERIKIIKAQKEEFVDGIGDLLFGLCRLANQLEVDVEKAFNIVHPQITKRYKGKKRGERA